MQYADGYKQKDFSGLNGRLVSSDGLSLQAYLERSFKKIVTTDETYQREGGIEYRDGLPIPKDSERIPQSMKIKELWEALAQRPYVKAYAVALGSSLINPAGLKGDIKSAYSDVCRSSFPYATDGSLPKPGNPITTSYGLKALSALFLEGVEKGTPHIAESQKYKEFDALHSQPPLRKAMPEQQAGPSAPAERAPEQSVVVPPEEPYDPQEQPHESSEHPNRLRYPERLYGPGLEQDSGADAANAAYAVDSGIASNSHQATMHAYQVFSPEFAQNGGLFMDNGVMANDSAVKLEYSSV
jgi:hypothetical protein